MKNKKLAVFSICIVVAICGAVIYTYYKHANLAKTDSEITTNLPPPGIPPARIPPEGFKEYKSPTYHFSLFYPGTLSVGEYKESGNGMTVAFQDTEGEKGFQIFVFPYADTQITEERFKMDVPSRVRKEPVDVMIDNVRATAFWSTNDLLGETREVWFISQGFLYEVTTYRNLDGWLSNVMKSWRFF